MEKEKLVICLSGGVNDDGSLPIHVQRRVNKAVELYKAGEINKFFFPTGTTRRNVDKHLESEAMRTEAIKQGVPADKIVCEIMSQDTFGNAVFARALYIDPKGIREFLVVTSAFHMPKTKLLFNYTFPKKQGFVLKYIEASDRGLNKQALKIRTAHEKYSCQFYKKEILPEIKPGDIKKLIVWQLEKNPSHTLVKNNKFKKFEKYISKNFSGNPLY
jgi:vancomycin permeability regulator SanA